MQEEIMMSELLKQLREKFMGKDFIRLNTNAKYVSIRKIVSIGRKTSNIKIHISEVIHNNSGSVMAQEGVRVYNIEFFKTHGIDEAIRRGIGENYSNKRFRWFLNKLKKLIENPKPEAVDYNANYALAWYQSQGRIGTSPNL